MNLIVFLLVVFVVSPLHATYTPPTCVDYNNTSLPVWPPQSVGLGTDFNVTVYSDKPALYILSPAVNASTVAIVATYFFAYSYAAGCKNGSSGVDFGHWICLPEYTGSGTNSVIGPNNNTDGNFIITLNSTGLSFKPRFFFIAQSSFNPDGDTITCQPYPLTLSIKGSYTKTCLNNGVLDLALGVCNCTANYSGDTCVFHGECSPSEGVSQCTLKDGKMGVKNCRVAGNFTTFWGDCQESPAPVPGSGSADKTPLYVGLGLGIGIAAAGITAGFFIARRQRLAYARVG